jgi:ribosomal protein S18 acetylase RimI-like enzyme
VIGEFPEELSAAYHAPAPCRADNSRVDIRVAGPDDAGALAQLRRQWRLERHGIALNADPMFEGRFDAWYVDQLRRGTRVWLAYNGDAPVGMLLMFVHERMPEPVRDPGRWGYIGNVYVLPEHRDSGIGRQLLDAATAHAEENDLTRLIVHPTDRSIPFYRRAGFSHDNPLMTRE